MVLTRKNFIAQAKILKTVRSDSVRKRLTEENIKVFKRSNPRFDAKKFRRFVEGKK